MSTSARFFVPGGALSGDAACYVERRADQELLDALRGGEFCYVLTSRQMGKSSLMVHTAAHLRRMGATVVGLDFTAIGQNLTPEQWYCGLLDLIGEQLDLEDELASHWKRHAELGPLQRWRSALLNVVAPEVRRRSAFVEPARELTGRLIVFVDEIDAVLTLPFATDEFFAAIRELHSHRERKEVSGGFAFCLLGVANPAELIQDPRSTPFNIGNRIELSDFTLDEARSLAVGFITHPQIDERIAQQLLARVWYWTRGHPYLTQRLCAAVSEPIQLKPPGKLTVRSTVDRASHQTYLDAGARRRDDNLLLVADRLLRSAPLHGNADSLLEMYQDVLKGRSRRAERNDPVAVSLCLTGVVAPDATGRLQVHNPIYRRVFDLKWVRGALTSAETQRRRRAYRLGLARAGTVALAMALLLLLTVRSNLEARQALAGHFKEFQANRRLVSRLETALASERRARKEAAVSESRAEAQKSLATARATEADRLRKSAEVTSASSRRRLAQALVASGWRRYDAGEGALSLLWFHEALRIDDPSRARMHRLRLGAMMLDLPELRSRWRQNGKISAIVSSPEARWVAVGSTDGQVTLWTARGTPKEIRHRSGVTALAFSPSAGRLAVGGRDGSIAVWEVGFTRPKLEFIAARHGGPVGTIAWSPDGTRLLSGGRDGQVALFDAGGSLRSVIRMPAPFTTAEFSPDGHHVLAACADHSDKMRGGARIWDGNTGEPKQGWLTTQGVLKATFLNGGSHVMLAFPNGAIEVRDAGRGEVLARATAFDGYLFSADAPRRGGGFGTLGPDGRVRLWRVDLERRTLFTVPTSLAGTLGSLTGFSYGAEGRAVTTRADDGSIRVWNAASGDPRIPSLWCGAAATAVALTSDQRYVVAGAENGEVRVWDLAGSGYPEESRSQVLGEQLVTDGRGALWVASLGGDVVSADPLHDSGRLRLTHPGPVNRLALSPDSRYAATASDEGTARLWDMATGRQTGLLRHNHPVQDVAFSRDGRRVVTASRGEYAYVWSVPEGRRISEKLHHRYAVMQTGFTANDRYLYTIETPYSPPEMSWLRLWRTSDFKQVGLPVGISGRTRGITPSPDGGSLLTFGGDNSAELWSIPAIHTPPPVLRHRGRVNHAVFSRDGGRIATASDDWTARIWDVKGRPLVAPLSHGSRVVRLAFSPDGSMLATGTAEGVVRTWDTATGEPISPRYIHRGKIDDLDFTRDGASLWVVADRAAHRRRISPLRGSGADLTRTAQMLAAHRLSDFVTPLAGNEAAQVNATDPQSAPSFRVARGETGRVRAWRRQEAERAEEQKDWRTALLHLREMARSGHPDLGIVRRYARAASEAGNLREASSAWNRTLQAGSTDPLDWHHAALVFLAADGQERYSRHCRRMLRHFGGMPGDRQLDLTAWTCALGTLPRHLQVEALRVVDRLLTRSPEHEGWQHTRAALLYRLGRIAEARATMPPVTSESSVGELLVAALIARAASDHNLAQKYHDLAQAKRQLPESSPLSWEDRLELRLFGRELFPN